jgi:hypothetical protein
MSFFDDTFHPEPADEPEPPDFAPPPWMGAPSNVIPGVAPVELLIGRTPNAAVAGRGPVPGVSSGRDPDIREGSDTD